jgi:4-hydroxybenzoate polyprenyltransferase
VRLVHPFPSLLVAGICTGLVRFAAADAPAGTYLRVGLGMLLYQFAIGIVNDVIDTDDDARTKPWKALPRGALGRRTATWLAAAAAGAGVITTAGLPTGAFLVGLLGLAAGLAYDVHFKRTALSWVPWAIAFPVIPCFSVLAAGAWDPLLWWTFPLGGVLGLSLNLANQSADVPAERRLGVRGAAHRLGMSRSRRLSLACFGLAASVAVLLLALREPDRAVYSAAAAATVALLAPRASGRLGHDAFFGLLAAGSAVLAVLFISAT